MTESEALGLMKAPGAHRNGIWRGRVLQIKITNVCNLSCNNCTAAVPQAKAHKKLWFMSPEQFRTALQSLKGFPGVIGIFGGNPCLHPKFEEICQIFVEEIPDQDQRGLWSNDLKGHVALCRETFSPRHSNLNVHRVEDAFLAIEKDWPEAVAARKEFMFTGLQKPSMHGSWWNAMQDVEKDEGKRWELISKCFVNQTWSAEITVIKGELRAFFCEFAATRAEFSEVLGEPDVGIPVEPGWWSQPMEFFKAQVCHYCHRCGAPLNPRKIEDLGPEKEDYTATNAKIFEGTKREGRKVATLEQVGAADPATAYLGKVVMAGQK